MAAESSERTKCLTYCSKDRVWEGERTQPYTEGNRSLFPHGYIYHGLAGPHLARKREKTKKVVNLSAVLIFDMETRSSSVLGRNEAPLFIPSHDISE